MKTAVFILWIIICCNNIPTPAQEKITNYREHLFFSIEDTRNVPKDSVFQLRLTNEKPSTVFPLEILKYKSLKYLHIGAIDISDLPEEFSSLQNLENLAISYNQNLKRFPESITKLKNLKELNIQGTGIDSLPNSIGNLKSLEVLNLCFTNINKLPQSFFNLKKMRELYIGYCVDAKKSILTEAQIEEIKSKLPNCKIFW